MSFYQSIAKPVTIEHEGRHLKTEDYPQFFSDMGFVIRGRTDEGEDIQLWMFIYIQRGAEIIVDGDVTQTCFIATKYSEDEKQTMHSSPYINKGQNIEDYETPGAIKISESSEETIWESTNRKFTCKPPHWHISGDHAGVETDITFKESSPGFFHCGAFEVLQRDHGAGYIMHGTAEGTIVAKGKIYKFKGYGVHERILQYGTVSDRTEYMNNRGLNWIHGWSEELSFFCFQGDFGNAPMCGIVNIGKESFTVSHGQGGIEEAAYWLDPKSKIMVPYKWKLWMITAEGKLEAEVLAYARGYYTWIRKHGTMVVNQLQADSKTKFTFNDGRVIEVPQIGMIEHMRTLYRQEE
jgi:hypothetical protein